MRDFSTTAIVELAAIVANHLQQHDINVVLVGGLAVEIYSDNLYLTKDIDMVDTSYQKPARINQAMAEIGFTKQGRVYINNTTLICVEFPAAPLAVGEELIKETTHIKTAAGDIPILFVSDVIKDRLAAYFYWQDKPSLVQALAIMINQGIAPATLKSFCVREGKSKEFKYIKALYKSAKQQQLRTMTEIEKFIISKALEEL